MGNSARILTLPLFVSLVGTNHANRAIAANDLTVTTNLFD